MQWHFSTAVVLLQQEHHLAAAAAAAVYGFLQRVSSYCQALVSV
jgi:hypothetical protein